VSHRFVSLGINSSDFLITPSIKVSDTIFFQECEMLRCFSYILFGLCPYCFRSIPVALPIKQFIGGEEYMDPNVSKLLNTKCECLTFDVLAVELQRNSS
jgi:hypothetical protein